VKEKKAKKPVKKTAKKAAKKEAMKKPVEKKHVKEKTKALPKKDEKQAEAKAVEEKKPMVAEYGVIIYPLITEKAINMIESENKLCFIVNRKVGKNEVRKAVEGNYKVKVDNVRILNDRKGRKKAIVKINNKFKADEIATKLGVL